LQNDATAPVLDVDFSEKPLKLNVTDVYLSDQALVFAFNSNSEDYSFVHVNIIHVTLM